MKTYLVLIREPDGRATVPSPEETHRHQFHWKTWIDEMIAKEHWQGGNSLSLTGKVVRSSTGNLEVRDGPYRVHEQEIVGGYLLIRANDLDEATTLLQTCPVFDADGFIEIREMM
ncbi:YciI family protein [Spirosoma sp. SC4-14]|uniref:YciI family protein n=1 Tax=Spirosoma sp. SC4-14 TaxID=3128900 RepID=UPI0030D48B77